MRRSGAGRSVAIAGLGLVGGSLARALTRAGYHVIGLDRPAVLRRARRAGAIAAALARIEDAPAAATVVILAAPPRANLRLLRRLAAGGGGVVTDVGSVKGPIVREAARLGLSRFVGGHPMAGSERAGFAASSADLFAGRPWVLTPTSQGRLPAALTAMVRATGARPVVMTAQAHDRAVAFLSHLPQIVAWALRDAALADRVAGRQLRIAGPAFHDMTRLARSPRALWREILQQNRREAERALRRFRARLALSSAAERGR